MIYSLGILMVGLAVTHGGRDLNNKALKSIPVISGSLVNLGKMDISIHLNSKLPNDMQNVRSETFKYPVNSFSVARSDPAIEEPCPCSALKNLKSPFLRNPSEMLSKILLSNDIFSFNQEPSSSPSCCGSHEHVQEDTVIFEFAPKSHPSQPSAQRSPSAANSAFPFFPLILENLIQNKNPAISSLPIKPKAVEIFFFPKKKDLSTFDFSKNSKRKEVGKKADIQIVGDKELKNEFKNLIYRPSLPIVSKKDESQDMTATKRVPTIVEDFAFSYKKAEKPKEETDDNFNRKTEETTEDSTSTDTEPPSSTFVVGDHEITTLKAFNTI